jgi:hypothetical protein
LATIVNLWIGTMLNLSWRKIRLVSIRGKGDDHCLLGLWRCDSFGCIVEMGDSQLRHLHQDTDRTWESFRMSLPSQESNRNLASARQCKAACKFEDWMPSQSMEWCWLLEQDKAWYQKGIHTLLYLISAKP